VRAIRIKNENIDITNHLLSSKEKSSFILLNQSINKSVCSSLVVSIILSFSSIFLSCSFKVLIIFSSYSLSVKIASFFCLSEKSLKSNFFANLKSVNFKFASKNVVLSKVEFLKFAFSIFVLSNSKLVKSTHSKITPFKL
jgi:hypothetical protein